MNVTMLVEELACSSAVVLGNCSKRTMQRWVKRVNTYLEQNDYDWRVRANYMGDNCILEVIE